MKLSKEYGAIVQSIYRKMAELNYTPQQLRIHFEDMKEIHYQGDFKRTVKQFSFRLLKWWPEIIDKTNLKDSHIHTVHNKFFKDLCN
jgi:hypothetical protein